VFFVLRRRGVSVDGLGAKKSISLIEAVDVLVAKSRSV
jgi:hypothetical protein